MFTEFPDKGCTFVNSFVNKVVLEINKEACLRSYQEAKKQPFI